jgi:putative ABC transport system permease protein
MEHTYRHCPEDTQPLTVRSRQSYCYIMSQLAAAIGSLPGAFRTAMRALGRSRATAALAVATMTVAIGATTAIFSIVYNTILRPLPYPEPHRLVVISTEFPSLRLKNMGLSVPEMLELQELTHSWSHVGGLRFETATLGGPEPRRVMVASASADLLAALAVQPIAGRLFTRDEDRPGASLVVLLGHGLWLRAFGGDPMVVGRSIDVDGSLRTVVGVMPRGFDLLGTDTDLWVPLALDPAAPGGRADHNMRVVARLAPFVSAAQARADLEAAVSRWMTTTGELHSPAPRFHPVSITPLHDVVVGDLRPTMMTLLGAAGFVLLLACANVSNVLLARSEARRHQLAVRVALGASRRRLLADHFLEALCLAAAGCIGGIALAYAASQAVVSTAVAWPRRDAIGVDAITLLFAVGATALCAIVFGLAPVLRLDLTRAQHWLRSDGRGQTVSRDRRRLQQVLIAWQIAAALTLLTGAGVLLRSFWRLAHVDPGVRAENVLTFQVSLPQRTFSADAHVWSFYERLLERISQLAGVRGAAAMSGRLPERRANNTTFFLDGVAVQGHDGLPQVEYIQHVTPAYFSTLGIRTIEGRLLTRADSERAEPVGVVNETLARKFWPNQDPIGRRLRAALPDSPWFRVVGVVSDVKHAGLAAAIGTELYVTHRQARVLLPGWLPTTMHVVIAVDARTADAVRSALPGVTRDVDAAAAGANVRLLEDALSLSIAGPRFVSAALASFAALALLLASIGIYGVVACSVSRRVSEFAVRMALGATPSSILRLVAAQAVIPIGAGLVMGLGGAVASRGLLGTLVFETSPTDPLTLAAVVAVLLVVAVTACWAPARRATRVDPLDALRHV